jgi:acetyl esterase/lipase
VSPAGARVRHRAVYLHGGGWVNEIESAHWRFIARLAAETQTAVRVPTYPLVPWGTAGDVVPRVAELVGAEIGRPGSRDTFVLGDSAGGQIALSSAIHLRDNNSEQPSRVFLIAPVLDAAMDNPGIAAVAPRDPWLSCAGVHVYARYWRGHLSLDDPLVSPLSAALEGLTALTIFSGTRDILYPLLPIPEGCAARRRIVDTINSTAGP